MSMAPRHYIKYGKKGLHALMKDQIAAYFQF